MQVGTITGNAGSGASVNLIGADEAGGFEFVTGTGSTGGSQFTLDLDTPNNPLHLTNSVSIVVFPLDAASEALFLTASGITSVSVGNQLVGISFVAWGTINDSTTYRFAYRLV